MNSLTKTLNLDPSEAPLLLAPLAGVSDHPFRRMAKGASLGFVEMLSSEAILNSNARTFAMMERHPEEARLGVQLTGSQADRIAKAVEILDRMHFDSIDLNMGCPVRKVVSAGCGAALLKDPEHVYATVKKCRELTAKIFSVKIRLGWDQQSKNAFEVVDAIEKAGADYVCIHARTRADDYAVPVDLDFLRRLKQRFSIPIVGNGNVFDYASYHHMITQTGVDGVMVSRGALGNPWVFEQIRSGGSKQLSLGEWLEGVLQHIEWARGSKPVCFRKHLLWYLKGWSGLKPLKDTVNTVHDFDDAVRFINEAAKIIANNNQEFRDLKREVQFFDPKFDMSRENDRGVGHLDLQQISDHNF